jgi:L-ribulokinase
MKNYVIGLDYGTDSVRAVLIDARSGREAASEIFHYPRWAEGKYCDPAANRFRQHPLDYLEGLEQTIKGVLAKGPKDAAENVAAISVDTTGSTPVAVDASGTALALLPEFQDNPNAMFVLWKDHTAVAEAAAINALAKSWGGEDFTRYSGGVYSSEWFWSKILHVLREDETVRRAAHSWVEHCDWIPAVLTGVDQASKIVRGRCSAGHKAMWHESWDGLPSEAFLTALDPLLSGLRGRLFRETVTAVEKAGGLCPEWAARLGLPVGLPVGAGAFDAHMGAVGGGAAPYALVKVIGTSTCDMLLAPPDEVGDILVRGICGQVDGSIVPGMIGMEAGQSAFGDLFAWLRDVLSWPLGLLEETGAVDADTAARITKDLRGAIIPALSKAASEIPPSASAPVALDWLNGRRTPDANQALTGAFAGLGLGSGAPAIFRSLVEAAAFGARMIAERFIEQGIPIREVIAIGGVARKSPFAMQVLADVFNMPIKTAASDQTVALGAAMFAAVVGGVFKDLDEAQAAMGCGFEHVYEPDPERVGVYNQLFERYKRLGAFVEAETALEGPR